MKTALLVFALLATFAFSPPAFAESWTFRLGPKDLPREFYSVGQYVPGLGLVPTGQYGGGRIAGIDPVTLGYRILASLPVGPGHESVSGFKLIDSGAGLDAFTEGDNGAQIYTAWADQGWKFRLTQTVKKYPWSLLGPSAARQGWVGFSEGRPRRQNGGELWAWLGARWGPITPTIPGLIIWDAAPYGGGILLGCSTGHGGYLDEWAGRLVWVQGGEWRLLNLPPMAGVIRLYRFDRWENRVWITTAWGESWYTDNPLDGDWVRWHRQEYRKQNNAFLHEKDGALAVATARGKLWHYPDPDGAGQKAAQIDGVLFMSLAPAPLPDNGWCLAGPMTYEKRGKLVSRPVGFYLK
jgi:hypothetical protein